MSQRLNAQYRQQHANVAQYTAQYHHTAQPKQHKKKCSKSSHKPSHSHSQSQSSTQSQSRSQSQSHTHSKSKSKSKPKYSAAKQHLPNPSHSAKQLTERKYSNESDQKDDIKHESHNRLTSHVGYASASNTISPQDCAVSQKHLQNSRHCTDYRFTDATVKELSNNLGFEEEYVKMALVQSDGDISFAAEILFQMNDKTIKAIKKIEKQKRRKQSSIPHFNAPLTQDRLGMTVKELKKQWKAVICDKSKSELRSISRKECLNHTYDSDSSSSEESDEDSSQNSPNRSHVSFYKKNKKEIETLCQCAKNLLFILKLYAQWCRDGTTANGNGSAYFHVMIDAFLSHYSSVQLINDFEHIHIYHWDHCELFVEFERIFGQCRTKECASFKRHFRDRHRYKNENKRYKLYGMYVDQSVTELQMKEVICKQWMDEIHCYLMHSLARFDLEREHSSEEEDSECEQSRSRSRSTSRSRNSAYMSRSQSPNAQGTHNTNKDKNAGRNNDKYVENERLMMERASELVKYGYGRAYGRRGVSNKSEEQKQSGEMGVFKWQSTLNRSSTNISPIFASMRDEILHNPYYSLSLQEWNELYLKSEQLCKSWIRKKIKCRDKYNGVIGINHKNKNIKLRLKKGDLITIEMVIAIKLYTDYDKLQFELKKCLRTGNNSKNRNRLCNLYWWRNLILIVVNKFGLRMKKNKFFYGLSQKLEIERFCGVGLFNGPLSLTVSLQIAKMYTMNNSKSNNNDRNGMFLQIGCAHPWLKGVDNCNGRYFDVSCVSDYKSEHEILAMLFTTRIYMISLNEYIPTNLNSVSSELFSFVTKLFHKCLFSMNYELEYLLIQLLSAQLHSSDNTAHKFSNVFHKLCLAKEYLMLWDISIGLQDFFLISAEYDSDFDDDSDFDNDHSDSNEEERTQLVVSFEKINELFPNLQSLTLINHILSNEVFYQFCDYLNQKNGNVSFEIVTFYFPKYKRLPHRLKIGQLRHVWQKHLQKHKWSIEAYKYGNALSPMIVLKRNDKTSLKPFIGHRNDDLLYDKFVKIEK